MKPASEIRKIMNNSNVGFKKECERIQDEIIKVAEKGNNVIIVSSPKEIAQRVRDEFTILGYSVQPNDSTDVTISW